MFTLLRPLQRWVCVAALVTAVGVPNAEVAAQNVSITFNSLTETVPLSGTRFVNNCYIENGFVFTAVGIGCTGVAAQDAFLAAGPNSPLFGGGATPSLLLNQSGATMIDVTRSGGGLFNARSIALAPFDMAMTTVLFTGVRATGPNVMQSFILGAQQNGFQTFSFSSGFSDLRSLRIDSNNEFGEPFVKMDDVALSVVPEPASIALVAAGLGAVAGFARRRRLSC